MPRAARWAFLAAASMLTVGQLYSLLLPHAPYQHWHKVTYDLSLVLISLVALLRATRGDRRGPWLLVALGITLWSLGDLYYTVVLESAEVVPFPSPADLGYQLMPPLVVAGVLWLTHREAPTRSRTLWVDGVAAACAIAAVLTAAVVAPVLRSPGGSGLTLVFTASPPIEDTVMLALTIGVLARSGWQVHRRTLLFVAGILAFSVTDAAYLVLASRGSYTTPSPIDAGWWLGLLLLALAASQPAPRRFEEGDDERTRLILAPLAFSTVALGVLIVASDGGQPVLAISLASASLLAVMVRLTLTFRQNVRMLRSSRLEAYTDVLTGLANRRGLTRELAARLRPESVAPFELVLFDLDGFKHYNDTYGHPAGDGLLQRLGARLTDHVAGDGHAFRLGGDEFCALIPISAGGARAAARALSETGDGFAITASYGAVALPAETGDPLDAMRIADQRLYADKHGRRGSAGRQSADALLGALSAHRPEIVGHANLVAELAEGVARQLDLPDHEVELVRQAGELHDIGKLGVPSDILEKPGALAPGEWQFVRQHTIIGQRIIGAAPALLPVARVVRSSHERWDGRGYPDALAGTEIPLASRVIAVADAFEAMVADRPYRRGRNAEAALAELRRCAGTQFDPMVVDAFLFVWAARAAGPERTPTAA